jgi:autotransporter-associated beta strand protein
MFSFRFNFRSRFAQLVLILLSVSTDAAFGLSVTNYSAAANNRFSSGYTSGPLGAQSILVPNTSSSFVGLGYDWSGVGWNASDLTQSFGMISPRHYVFAEHYARPYSIQFYGAGGLLYTDYTDAPHNGINTACGPAFTATTTPDISLGVLSAPIPPSAQIAYYPLLDLVPSTSGSDYSSYVGRGYFMYGWTGRAAVNTTGNLYYYYTGYSIISSTASALLQTGDSGSPDFLPWIDPNGKKHLTILGYNWGVSSVNFEAFLPANDVTAKLNTMMAREGYALRWVANASGTWQGTTSALFSNSNCWSPKTVPVDKYVAFAGNLASRRTISLGANQSLRGIAFLNATAGNLFSFQSGSTLTVGRGGIINYDSNNRQSFACDMALSDAQWWDCGVGGLSFTGNIETNGYLLVVDGTGSTLLGGSLSGTGGIAKDGAGMLTVSASNSFTGPIFVHNGILNLTGTANGIGSVTIELGGALEGTGRLALSGSNCMAVNGGLSPGDAVTAGTLSIAQTSGTLKFGSTGNLVFNAGTLSDRIELGGGYLALGGTLQIVQNSGFSYLVPYTIFSGLGTTPIGSFSAVSGLASGFKTVFSTSSGNYTVSFIPTTFAAWQQAYFTAAEIASGLADDTADPDRDGQQNLSEYALGLNPRLTGMIGVPSVAVSGSYLTLTATKNPNATDLTYTVEVTGTLTAPTSWNSTETTVLQNTATTLVVRDNLPITAAPRRFIRLRITRF